MALLRLTAQSSSPNAGRNDPHEFAFRPQTMMHLPPSVPNLVDRDPSIHHLVSYVPQTPSQSQSSAVNSRNAAISNMDQEEEAVYSPKKLGGFMADAYLSDGTFRMRRVPPLPTDKWDKLTHKAASK